MGLNNREIWKNINKLTLLSTQSSFYVKRKVVYIRNERKVIINKLNNISIRVWIRGQENKNNICIDYGKNKTDSHLSCTSGSFILSGIQYKYLKIPICSMLNAGGSLIISKNYSINITSRILQILRSYVSRNSDGNEEGRKVKIGREAGGGKSSGGENAVVRVSWLS
jgi:hypothetical protein